MTDYTFRPTRIFVLFATVELAVAGSVAWACSHAEIGGSVGVVRIG